MRERLAAYQQVLALCREAFPSETPADDLLAEVIAEAHEVSRRPKLRDSLEGEGSGWRRFWERWRGTVLPSVALAGTAAAVLFLLEPDMMLDNNKVLLADNSQEKQATNNLEDRKGSQPASEPTLESRGAKDDEQPQDPDDVTAPEQQPDPLPDPPPDPLPDSLGKPSSKTHKNKSAAATPAIAPSQEPAPEPMSKDDTWTSLERANAARRTGNCDRARSIYDDVIAASSDSNAVTHAQAGIGLCLEQDRRTSEANAWFDDARSANPGIDAWINKQRDEQPLPGEKKKPKKSEPFDADSI